MENQTQDKNQIQKTQSHPFYPQCNPEDADALAWAFVQKDKMQKYYFKFLQLGNKDIRIRVMYSSLCHSDVLKARGLWGQTHYPICVGHEVIGEVVLIGDKVTKFKKGDIVLFGPLRDSCGHCQFCKEGDTIMCDLDPKEKYQYAYYFGGYATHMQSPESHCFKLPDGMDPSTSPSLMCAGVTTFTPINQFLKSGMKILILGFGGLGHLAAQFCLKKDMQVDTFTTTKNQDKINYMKRIGVEGIFDSNNKKNFVQNSKSYDAILHSLPVALTREQMDDYLQLLKPRGKFILLGMPPVDQSFICSYDSIVSYGIEIIGSLVGGIKHTEEVLQFSKENGIKAKCEFFDFEDFPKAFDKLENGTPLFRCVVNVDKFSKAFNKF